MVSKIDGIGLEHPGSVVPRQESRNERTSVFLVVSIEVLDKLYRNLRYDIDDKSVVLYSSYFA